MGKPKKQLLVLCLLCIIIWWAVAPEPLEQGSRSLGVLWAQGERGLPSPAAARAVPGRACTSSVPVTLCCHSWQPKPLLAASALKSFSLMVFLLFCLTCFCSSQQRLFVILMSSLCHYSSFPSHEHFSTWVERFRAIFCNSVLAFHCGPESVFLLLF